MTEMIDIPLVNYTSSNDENKGIQLSKIINDKGFDKIGISFVEKKIVDSKLEEVITNTIILDSDSGVSLANLILRLDEESMNAKINLILQNGLKIHETEKEKNRDVI